MKKAKGTVFIEHIEGHLNQNSYRLYDEKVICKICEKTVEEIYEEWKERKHKK